MAMECVYILIKSTYFKYWFKYYKTTVCTVQCGAQKLAHFQWEDERKTVIAKRKSNYETCFSNKKRWKTNKLCKTQQSKPSMLNYLESPKSSAIIEQPSLLYLSSFAPSFCHSELLLVTTNSYININAKPSQMNHYDLMMLHIMGKGQKCHDDSQWLCSAFYLCSSQYCSIRLWHKKHKTFLHAIII